MLTGAATDWRGHVKSSAFSSRSLLQRPLAWWISDICWSQTLTAMTKTISSSIVLNLPLAQGEQAEGESVKKINTEAKIGRPEDVSENTARAISKMIARMPDSGIPVTWDNVRAHCEKRFNIKPSRQTLSQKVWNGKKLVGIAFIAAQQVQRQIRKGAAPKYSTSPRSVLQQRILTLEVEIQNLRDELGKVRSQQIDALDAFMTTPLELRELLRESGLA